MMDLLEHGCFKDHPKVERENAVKFQQRVWKELYNCGKDVPKGIVLDRPCVCSLV